MQVASVWWAAGLPLVVAIIADAIVRIYQCCDDRRHVRALLALLLYEVREGVHRCDSLVALEASGRHSYSRIYTAAWDSSRTALAEHGRAAHLPDEILTVLHRLYYRFDLVNFNMEASRFRRGAAFAREYQTEIHVNYQRLLGLMSQRNIRLPESDVYEPPV